MKVTWTSYWTVVTVAVIIYYIFIGYKYFRFEIIALFSKKEATPTLPEPEPGPEIKQVNPQAGE